MDASVSSSGNRTLLRLFAPELQRIRYDVAQRHVGDERGAMRAVVEQRIAVAERAIETPRNARSVPAARGRTPVDHVAAPIDADRGGADRGGEMQRPRIV